MQRVNEPVSRQWPYVLLEACVNTTQCRQHEQINEILTQLSETQKKFQFIDLLKWQFDQQQVDRTAKERLILSKQSKSIV